MKKPVFFLLFSFLISTPSFASISFVDIGGVESRAGIEWLQERGVVQGYSDGTYQPNRDISRAEFLKIVLGSVDESSSPIIKCTKTELKNIQNTFKDVNENDWFAQTICNAYKSGIIQGYEDKTFRPHQIISRAEGSKIVVLANQKEIPSAKGEWFTPFLSVMKDEKVVSPDFLNAPHKNLTRGEMADLSYRMATGNEKVNGDELQSIGSCSALINQMQKAEKRVECWGCGGGGGGNLIPMMSMAKTNTAEKSSDDFSSTNTQEANVDESDIVKNDGSHIFLAKDDTVKIIKAYPIGEFKEEASINLEGVVARDLYLQKNTLVVIGLTSGGVSWGRGHTYSSGTTDILIYDVSDRKNPKKIRTAQIDGSMVSSRITNGTLYAVINAPFEQSIYMANEGGKEALPRIDGQKIACSSIKYFPNFKDHHITNVVALDINNPNEKMTVSSFLGVGNNIYMSENNLYLVGTENTQVLKDENGVASWKWEELSNIFKFGLEKTKVSLVSKGKVEGRVLNQYSMSEYNDYFRIATQRGRAWGNELSDNKVTIFDKNLKKTGEITGIAKGEDIKSARFVGNKGYLVTFKTVDPLFVLDMTPTNPKIEGELKIPGWSDYLHPVDENHLLGIGKEVDESIDADKVHDENAIYYTAVQGVKLSMFDISDVKNPKEVYKTVIGERNTETEAAYNPKALFIDTSKKLIGFPISVTQKPSGENSCTVNADNTCSKGCIPQCEPCQNPSGICPAICKIQCISERSLNNSTEPVEIFQGAMLFSWGNNGFVKQGETTNYPAGFDFYNNWNDLYSVSRLIRIGENFYSLSNGFVKALDKNLKTQKELSFISGEKCEVLDEYACTQRIDCEATWVAPSCAPNMMCTEAMQFERCKIKK